MTIQLQTRTTLGLLIMFTCVGTLLRPLSAAGAPPQNLGEAAVSAGVSVPALKVGSGSLVGVTTNSDGVSLGTATIVIHSMDGAPDHRLQSDSNGVFSLDALIPGSYRVTAYKEGFVTSVPATIEIGRSQTVQTRLTLTADPNATSAKSADAQLTDREKQLLDRIERLEARLVAMETKEKPATETGTSSEASAAPATIHPEPTLVASLTAIAAATPAQVSTPQAPLNSTPAAGSPPPTANAATPAAPNIPQAVQSPEPAPAVDNFTPFAYGDFTWLNGSSRNKDTVLDTKFFTAEVRFDTHYMEDYNQPIDHTIVGSTESFRSGEVQIEQASVGGDFHWQNVRGRILFMQGLFATTTSRNDASSATGSYPGNTGGVGQWNLQDAYKYVSEAYGGYHFNVNHGLNVDAGIFVSYVGLFSYYNFDNWTYQPSYVSSNTPWFFNGFRAQWFPTNKLKIEPWFVNGWQSYAKYNGHPGLGGQLLWMPKEWFKLVANQYGFGEDNLGLPKTQRIHTDDSIEVRWFNQPESTGLSKVAFSLTVDAGCQYGGGISCTGHGGPKSSFLGWMTYHRMWFHKDLFAVTLGGGQMNNTGRYLTLLPPIDGAWAASGTPYFTENPGEKAHMWDSTINFQYMPRQYITWWAEVGYRHSDVPYFAGRGGVTPPGGDNGLPQYYTCMSGVSAGTANLGAAYTACGGPGSVWFPDLRRSEVKTSIGVMVKF